MQLVAVHVATAANPDRVYYLSNDCVASFTRQIEEGSLGLAKVIRVELIDLAKLPASAGAQPCR